MLVGTRRYAEVSDADFEELRTLRTQLQRVDDHLWQAVCQAHTGGIDHDTVCDLACRDVICARADFDDALMRVLDI